MPGGLHPHAGREVGGTKAHRLQAGGTGGDFFDMRDPCRRLDDHFQSDSLLPPRCRLDRGDQRIHRIDIRRAADLGDHDLVKPWSRLFQKVHDVAIPERGIQAIDPHRQGLLAPVHLGNRLDDVRPRLRLVGGGDRILKVQVDHIRRTRRHLGEKLGARTGCEQLAPVRAGRGGGLQTEAHGADLRAIMLRRMLQMRYNLARSLASGFRRCSNSGS